MPNKENQKEGLRLTYATLASIAKYPCESSAKEKGIVHRKKFGFFQAEKETFATLATALKLIKDKESPISYLRHPFVWLVEAADDICYNIIDLEDAHRLGIIPSNQCEELLIQVLEDFQNSLPENVKTTLASIQNRNERISYLRANVIGVLIRTCVNLYQEHFELILDGKLDKGLVDQLFDQSVGLQTIQEFSIKHIYNHRSVIEIENAGYNVMYELLQHFIEPLIQVKKSNADRMALKLIPNQFLYPEGTLYEQMLGIIDYVSGMTDNYATMLYRKIKGIEIGMRH